MGFRLEELFVYIAIDVDGDETVPLFPAPVAEGYVIFIAADRKRLAQLRPLAKEYVRSTGRPLRLVRFIKDAVLEDIES